MPERHLSKADARLLYSIAYAQRHYGNRSLEGIFAAEDGMNRSAPTGEELRIGLSALAGAGLVSCNDATFSLTPEGERLKGEADARGGTIFDRIDRLASLLHSHFGAVEGAPVELSDAAIRQSYDAYYSRSS